MFGKLSYSECIEIKRYKAVSQLLKEFGKLVTIPDEEVELLRKLKEKGIAYQVENMVIGKDEYVVESCDF